MDPLALTTAINRLNIPTFTNARNPSFSFRNTRIQSLSSRRTRFRVLASKDDEPSSLDRWDQMELKFGQLIGEDPNLTLAKVMGRKANPEVSYLDIEKSFNKKKGKLVDNEVKNIPFEGSKERKSSPNSLDGLNLVRPIPKKGVKFETENPPSMKIKKPNMSVEKASDNNTTKGSIPNVILRKPATFKDDNADTKKPSRLMIKPNLLLKMRNEQKKEQFSDITLLKRPEPLSVGTNISDIEENGSSGVLETSGIANATKSSLEESRETGDVSFLRKPELKVDSVIGLQPPESSDIESAEEGTDVSEASGIKLVDSDFNLSIDAELQGKLERLDQSVSAMESDEKEMAANEASGTTLVDASVKLSITAALQGKPKRLDQKDTSDSSSAESLCPNPESYIDAVEIEDLLETSSPLKERELADWARAEDLFKTGAREEVELISSSTRGFVASFGSMIGFLPYRNLVAKWKFLAFESWLRRKGLDPSTYKQNLGIIGSQEVAASSSLDSIVDTEKDQKIEGEITPDMKLDDLLRIYDNEKIKFLSSFVGQKIKVNVVMADRNSRKLIFSGRPREKEEMVEKKRSLMAKLSIGDVVKCCIKKITYFGIFVEVEGVPALIHQTEVSWDATLDPASFYKVGQIVDAKVHQLDFALERITLSLKEITPDPLIEALEAVVGDRNPMDGRLEAAQADTEWDDVESLIKELQQIEGVESVSKGRFFLSPGLAPTFQVYMASMFENQYKLLARSGNKVQEVIVKASLDKEEMKNVILTCTNRVE